MNFDTNEVNKINNGILKLSQYFNGLLSDKDTPINFKNELSNLFEYYKNDTKYRNKKNLKFIGNICNQISNFENSIDKDIIWFKEGTDLEPKNFQDFLSVYIDIFNLCSDMDLYFEKINPSNNNEDIILLEGDKAYKQFTFSDEDITTKVISNYTINENSISANYEIDISYLKAFDWVEKCKTEKQRRNLLNVPYEDKNRIFLQTNTINKIPFYNVFVADFICENFNYFENYKKGYKKGVRFFNENYKVSLPNIEQVKQISELYNSKFKSTVLSINSIYNLENIKKIGFENGLLHAYSEFEESYINLFEDLFLKESKGIINDEKDNVNEIQTKTTILKNKLTEYGFFKIDKIICLSEKNKNILIEKMANKGLPYSIAMLDYLKFIKYLNNQYFQNKTTLHKELATWFLIKDKEGRSIKGNINSLEDYSNENKKRYTAYKHKETVINDYQELI